MRFAGSPPELAQVCEQSDGLHERGYLVWGSYFQVVDSHGYKRLKPAQFYFRRLVAKVQQSMRCGDEDQAGPELWRLPKT